MPDDAVFWGSDLRFLAPVAAVRRRRHRDRAAGATPAPRHQAGGADDTGDHADHGDHQAVPPARAGARAGGHRDQPAAATRACSATYVQALTRVGTKRSALITHASWSPSTR